MIGRTQEKGYAIVDLTFSDTASIPAYATYYIQTMAAQGVISGYADFFLLSRQNSGESVLAEPHRHQCRHASHTAAVLHHECIPVAVRSVHHTALRDSVTVEGQVVVDNFTRFESAIQGFGHQAGFCFALALREVTGEDVIASIMLV